MEGLLELCRILSPVRSLESLCHKAQVPGEAPRLIFNFSPPPPPARLTIALVHTPFYSPRFCSLGCSENRAYTLFQIFPTSMAYNLLYCQTSHQKNTTLHLTEIAPSSPPVDLQSVLSHYIIQHTTSSTTLYTKTS